VWYVLQREFLTVIIYNHGNDCHAYLQIQYEYRFQALSAAIKTAEADPSMQALVLQSHNPAVFSAGLDLLEMHQPNPDRLAAFWTAFQQLYLDLYGSRLSCIAAMEGAAPAAGCMLALSCDYRIMAATDAAAKGGKPTIGLNESRIGIVAPPFLARQFMDTIGRRQAALGLSLGTLYSSEQALAIGLVDQVLPRDQVRPAAQAAAAQWAQIPGSARLAAKLLVRGPALHELQTNRQKDVDDFCAFITSAQSQQGLTAYLALLAQKGKKKT
jgi:3,2-trans-enoyl-CoA isomerase